MSGVLVIGHLAAAHAPLTAIVPAGSIKEGPLAQGASLPALAVEQISSVDQQLLDQTVPTFIIDRVQVTIFARDVRQRRQIAGLLRDACAGKRGDMLGLIGVDVQTAGQGPDFYDDRATIFMRTLDFRVAFNTA